MPPVSSSMRPADTRARPAHLAADVVEELPGNTQLFRNAPARQPGLLDVEREPTPARRRTAHPAARHQIRQLAIRAALQAGRVLPQHPLELRDERALLAARGEPGATHERGFRLGDGALELADGTMQRALDRRLLAPLELRQKPPGQRPAERCVPHPVARYRLHRRGDRAAAGVLRLPRGYQRSIRVADTALHHVVERELRERTRLLFRDAQRRRSAAGARRQARDQLGVTAPVVRRAGGPPRERARGAHGEQSVGQRSERLGRRQPQARLARKVLTEQAPRAERLLRDQPGGPSKRRHGSRHLAGTHHSH